MARTHRNLSKCSAGHFVDFARSRYVKSAAARESSTLGPCARSTRGSEADLVALDEVVTALAAIDQHKTKIFRAAFLWCLSVKEAAEVLRVSAEAVVRDWVLA